VQKFPSQNAEVQQPNKPSYRAESYHILKPMLCRAFWTNREAKRLQGK
jgi:hypothetical protein